MILAFLALSASATWSRRLPPLIGALVVGVAAIILLGEFHSKGWGPHLLAHPNLYAPVFTRPMPATPAAFIGALAGLAMLRVLQTAFSVSFRGRCTLGGLVTFLVTVADVPVLGVGAPFWGLVIGYTVSRLLERKDFDAAGA